MRAAHYSWAVQLGLGVSFAVGGAWGAYHLLRQPPSSADVRLDIGELRSRAAELVALFDARAVGALTQPYLDAQHRQWEDAVRGVNKSLVAAMPNDADAARAHDAAVELLRVGESLPRGTPDRSARDAAARITDALIAAERARTP